MHLQKPVANLKCMWQHNSSNDSPVFETTSGPPTLPCIDTDPSIKHLLLPDERSLSDIRIPPIKPPTIDIPLLNMVDERCNSSENVDRKSKTISMITQAPLCTTHTTRGAAYHLSTDTRVSAMNVPFPGYPHRSDRDTIEIDNQLRQSSLLHPTTCAPTNTCTAFPTQPTQPPSEKPWNRANLASFSLFRRIRRFLASTRDRPPPVVWIMPAQFEEVNIPSPPSVVA
ncbi:hypothetical protein EDD16DRAFT_813335 [Pisolithus croceorrhizus]|nr:hypothetical protein EDD16DRAFT_813335 [Pisolithus croceorrhizus]